jgi:excisionase family DNA binding protein
MPKTIQGVTLYTIPEAAEELGVSTNSVRSYLRSGRLTGTRIGRPILITAEAIADLVQGIPSSSTSENIPLQK